MRKIRVLFILLILAASISLLSACDGESGNNTTGNSDFENTAGWLADLELRESLITAIDGYSETMQFSLGTVDESQSAEDSEEKQKDVLLQGDAGGGVPSPSQCMTDVIIDSYKGLYKAGFGWFINASHIFYKPKNKNSTATDLAYAINSLDQIEKDINKVSEKIDSFAKDFNEFEIEQGKVNTLGSWATILNESNTRGNNFEKTYDTFVNNLGCRTAPDRSYLETVEYVRTSPNLNSSEMFSTDNNSILYAADSYLKALVGKEAANKTTWEAMTASANRAFSAMKKKEDVNLIKYYYSYGATLGKMGFETMTRMQRGFNVFAIAIILNAYNQDDFNFCWDATKGNVNIPSDVFGTGDGTDIISFPIYQYDAFNSPEQFSENEAQKAINDALEKLAHNFGVVYTKEFNARAAKFASFYNGDALDFIRSVAGDLIFCDSLNESNLQPLVYVHNYKGGKRTDYFAADYILHYQDGYDLVETYQLFIPHAKDDNERLIQDDYLLAIQDIRVSYSVGLCGTLNDNIRSCSPEFWNNDRTITKKAESDCSERLIVANLKNGLIGLPKSPWKYRNWAWFGYGFTDDEYKFIDSPTGNAIFVSDTRAYQAKSKNRSPYWDDKYPESSDYHYFMTPSGHLLHLDINQIHYYYQSSGFGTHTVRDAAYRFTLTGIGNEWSKDGWGVKHRDGTHVEMCNLDWKPGFGGMSKNLELDIELRNDANELSIDKDGYIISKAGIQTDFPVFDDDDDDDDEIEYGEFEASFNLQPDYREVFQGGEYKVPEVEQINIIRDSKGIYSGNYRSRSSSCTEEFSEVEVEISQSVIYKITCKLKDGAPCLSWGDFTDFTLEGTFETAFTPGLIHLWLRVGYVSMSGQNAPFLRYRTDPLEVTFQE